MPSAITGRFADENAAPHRPAQTVTIFVAQHCAICAYSYEVAELIRCKFPQVTVEIVDVETEQGKLPEAVFATPTYLVDGRLWSLGNPSPRQIDETFARGNPSPANGSEPSNCESA